MSDLLGGDALGLLHVRVARSGLRVQGSGFRVQLS